MWQPLSVLRIGLLICVIRRTQSEQLHMIVEYGQSATLQCLVPITVKQVTWQVLNSTKSEVSLTTCNPSGVCMDQDQKQFQGHIANSPLGYKSTLAVLSANIEETQFTCLTDTGDVAANISLEVYVRPRVISCSQKLIFNQYATVTCETNIVYPGISAYLYRKEPINIIFDANYSSCHVFLDGSASCTWRVPFSNLLDLNTFYVRMYAMVWNDIVVGRPAVSSDIMVSFYVPHVLLYNSDCPVGPGVIGEYIKIGTLATCKCRLNSAAGPLISRARWYTQDGAVVGTEHPSGQFSVLTLAYNASNENAAYDCRGDNPSLVYYHVQYTPKFTSSAPQSLTSGLSCVLALGAACISLALKRA